VELRDDYGLADEDILAALAVAAKTVGETEIRTTSRQHEVPAH